MSQKRICDFCGCEINEYSWRYLKQGGILVFLPEGQPKSNLTLQPNRHDLCSECCNKVINFIDREGRMDE